jgi:hypothetical protein
MATYDAIAATSEAIRRYLKEAPREEFPQLDVVLYQPADFSKSVPTGGLVSLFLYRIGVNRRNLPPTYSKDQSIRFKPPVAIDLFYLVSAWALNADFQQRLLGWTIRALEDCSILPATMLNRLQAEDVFRPTECVELSCESPSLQDMSFVWDLIKPNPPLSITYVAHMVAIESRVPLREGALVQARGFGGNEPSDERA